MNRMKSLTLESFRRAEQVTRPVRIPRWEMATRPMTRRPRITPAMERLAAKVRAVR